MVELIVVFGLIAIFISTATVLLSSMIRVHNRLDNLSKVQVVSDTLIETILGEVSAAADVSIDVGEPDTACYIEQVDSDFDKLHFVAKNGYEVTLGADAQGYMEMNYEGGEGPWAYGANTYMNNYITKFQFEQVEDKNLIQVTLRLKNRVNGYEFETTKIIKCYNLSSASIETGSL